MGTDARGMVSDERVRGKGRERERKRESESEREREGVGGSLTVVVFELLQELGQVLHFLHLPLPGAHQAVGKQGRLWELKFMFHIHVYQ